MGLMNLIFKLLVTIVGYGRHLDTMGRYLLYAVFDCYL